MQDVIKKQLREGLMAVDELTTKPKAEFGKGTEHSIYASPNNPNVLYKIGTKKNVEKWSGVFKSNPELFPKIYRSGQLKDGRCYVEIEKLNAEAAVKDWGHIEDALEKIGVIDTDVFNNTIDQLFIHLILGNEDYNKIHKWLSVNKPVQALFSKWVDFLTRTYEYIKGFGYNGLDIHRYNFAYDQNGNPKAIDI